MSMGRLAGLLLCAAALLLAGPVGFATAETYPVEIRFTHNVFGEKVFKGEIATENGRFETFMISGNSRVHLTGSVSGDTVSVYGELQISGTWRFKPFSADGAFSDSPFNCPATKIQHRKSFCPCGLIERDGSVDEGQMRIGLRKITKTCKGLRI